MELITKNTKTNKEKVVIINSSPVYSKSGDILASITTILDITQFKKTERDLVKLIKGRKVISQEFNNRLLNILYTTINLLQICKRLIVVSKIFNSLLLNSWEITFLPFISLTKSLSVFLN